MTNPILVFDSGVGGLSILEEIRKQLPDHDYVYLFDNARLPYGELEEQMLKKGAIELISRVVEKTNATMIVVACNTASTLILPSLRAALSIPVVGVVPAIKPASEQTKTKHIALLATPATILRAYTKELITSFAKGCQVELIASSRLVQIAESKLKGEKVDQNQIAEIVEPIVNKNIDTLVLGCTHFPLLRKELTKILGNKVQLLDSGVAIANRVTCLLKNCLLEKTLESTAKIIGIYTSKSINTNLKKALLSQGFDEVIPYQ